MLNDVLANALSVIKCYDKMGRVSCNIQPVSKIVKNVLKILNTHNYVGLFEEITQAKGGILKINLLRNINHCGVVKPRFSFQVNELEKFEKRYLPAKGMGILIVSTSKGYMTHEEAKKQNIGGRLIAYCY